jgi:spore coat protein U-like protein
MDFGILETDESQRIYLQVRANTTVAIELSSENEGVLKLDGAPGAAPIEYSLTFDGERGSGSSWRTSRTPPLTLAGASYPIDVQIGAVEGRFAGRYRDTVTITVIPN